MAPELALLCAIVVVLTFAVLVATVVAALTISAVLLKPLLTDPKHHEK